MIDKELYKHWIINDITLDDILKSFNMKHKFICMNFERNGLKLKRVREATLQSKNVVKDKVINGLSTLQIVDKYGITKQRVSEIIKAAERRYRYMEQALTILEDNPIGDIAYANNLAGVSYIIRERRINLGYSQIDLANTLGVSLPTVSYWENGRKNPSLKNIRQLVKHLGGVVSDYR